VRGCGGGERGDAVDHLTEHLGCRRPAGEHRFGRDDDG
jgi:hypothetical protein